MAVKHRKEATKKKTRLRGPIYIILAIIVFLTPVVITHLKNIEQNRLAQYYSESVRNIEPAQKASLLEEAREYNRNLPEFGSLDPWVNGIDVSTPGYKLYLEQLNIDSMMGRLRVPSVGIDLPIYHGTSTSTLAHGVGHLYGTALPVGGKGTHSVLTGHTGLATLTMFDNLTHIKTGDVFTIEVLDETLAYEVDQIVTVLPEDVANIKPEVGQDFVTLVTCTPYGINTHRLLVRGHRTELIAEQFEKTYTSPWQVWMKLAVAISLLALLYLFFLLWRRRRKQKEENGQSQAAHLKESN
ncbi:hypothetical protein CPHO_03255 [Corynebacterium phocae]|uniref:Uncharacterized protein n=2 Tax=Corynebacterium phocae TaxID=161895 RepID=A0A1L7D6G8_9CORY|nr:hypothetical protein CPHO_03255 [Corynebacterium phocae]KAA8726539.1 class C sortase [Corynebacterium phocae]